MRRCHEENALFGKLVDSLHGKAGGEVGFGH